MSLNFNNMIKVGSYLLADERKYRRAFEVRTGGVGPEAKEEEILACYDKFGGRVYNLKNEVVPQGTFWDFENKKPVVIKKEAPKKVVKKKVAKKKVVKKKK